MKLHRKLRQMRPMLLAMLLLLLPMLLPMPALPLPMLLLTLLQPPATPLLPLAKRPRKPLLPRSNPLHRAGMAPARFLYGVRGWGHAPVIQCDSDQSGDAFAT